MRSIRVIKEQNNPQCPDVAIILSCCDKTWMQHFPCLAYLCLGRCGGGGGGGGGVRHTKSSDLVWTDIGGSPNTGSVCVLWGGGGVYIRTTDRGDLYSLWKQNHQPPPTPSCEKQWICTTGLLLEYIEFIIVSFDFHDESRI